METIYTVPEDIDKKNEPKLKNIRLWKILLSLGIFIIIAILMIYYYGFDTPSNFPVGKVYNVSKGVGLNSLATNLNDIDSIKSPFWFKVSAVILSGTKGIVAGDYVLDTRENTFILAKRMTSGDFRLKQIKFTIPEGLNIFEIAKIVSSKLTKISEKDFIKKTSSLEGYLFPDTYIFQTNTGLYTVIEAMQANFKKKILSVQDLIKSSGHNESDIIKMASIVEEEARTTESRKIIAGILWKRISLGMPLQVDASFRYINGKVTKDLTLTDLKIDSPYNSYVYKGLPPTPICNPGLDSITATIQATKTDYLYFLTDMNGVMHYAKTFQEHILNKQKYLP